MLKRLVTSRSFVIGAVFGIVVATGTVLGITRPWSEDVVTEPLPSPVVSDEGTAFAPIEPTDAPSGGARETRTRSVSTGSTRVDDYYCMYYPSYCEDEEDDEPVILIAPDDDHDEGDAPSGGTAGEPGQPGIPDNGNGDDDAAGQGGEGGPGGEPGGT